MPLVPGQAAVEPARRVQAFVLWAGLLVAFSPALLDLVRHMAEHPWARYALLFPFLFARCALAERESPPEHRDGILWIGLGMGAELAGILTGTPGIGRVGLVLAAVGLCRRFGLASSASLILLAFIVPLPSAVFRWISPEAESILLSLAGGGLAGLGIGLDIAGTRAAYGVEALVLARFDSGAALVPLLAGLSWYRSQMLASRARSAVARAVAAPLLAIPVQIVAIGLALLTLPLGAGAAGRFALTHLPWIAVAAFGIGTTELRLRRGRATRER